MLPLRYHVLAPYIRRDKRLIALHSGENWGETEIDDEHLLRKLDNILQSFNDGDYQTVAESIRAVPFPQLDMPRLVPHVPFDLRTGLDRNGQSQSILERFHAGRAPFSSLASLGDVATRLHRPVARGIERELIDMFNRLDEEALNRKNIKIFD